MWTNSFTLFIYLPIGESLQRFAVAQITDYIFWEYDKNYEYI